jgi:hypothetical protein
MEVGGWYKVADNSGGADFSPLQVGLASPSNAVGFIFQARESGSGAGLAATTFGTGSLVGVNDGLHMAATIVNQTEQDAGTGAGWNLTNDAGTLSAYIINGVVERAIRFAAFGTATTTACYAARVQGESNNRFEVRGNGDLRWGSGSGAVDVSLVRLSSVQLGTGTNVGFRAGGGAWDNGHLALGNYRVWVDATGDLRIKNGAPTGDTDGTVVGTQT